MKLKNSTSCQRVLMIAMILLIGACNDDSVTEPVDATASLTVRVQADAVAMPLA